MAAGDARKLLKVSDFPFKNAKTVADFIVDRALRTAGYDTWPRAGNTSFTLQR